MSNKCPKCGEKLSPLYMKQTCPKCNTNLVYYDLDNRLKADHEQAMREQEAVDKMLNNIKTSAFGGALQITRFVLMFSPLLWMCLPTFKTDSGENITLISVIMGIINGNYDFNNSSYLFPFITMVCIILFSLMVIISSLFSVGEKSIKRIQIFQKINYLALSVCSILCMVNGAYISFGVLLTLLTYVGTDILHGKIDKKINK